MFDPNNYVDWAAHYPELLFRAKRFIYKYWIPYWHGQEEDIAADVVQETMQRTIQYLHKVAQGKAKPVGSIEQLMAAIARNYVFDLRRRDRRMVRLSDAHEHEIDIRMIEDTSETATEHIYLEWLFLRIAREINQLPHKQRRAILIDIANRMSFNRQLTPLQAAFLTVGIALQDYQQPLPENSVERARHAALLCLAYKSLAQFAIMHRLSSIA
jgi:RNA polymerase sigma factor (sigma-70 family)